MIATALLRDRYYCCVCFVRTCMFSVLVCAVILTVGSCDSGQLYLSVCLFVHLLVYMLSCSSLERYFQIYLLGSAEVSRNQLHNISSCIPIWLRKFLIFFPVMCWFCTQYFICMSLLSLFYVIYYERLSTQPSMFPCQEAC